MSDNFSVPKMPQDLWHAQMLHWLRLTFNDLYHRAQVLEDLVRTVTDVTDGQTGRSLVDLSSEAWSLAITAANTPRPPLPYVPLDLGPHGHNPAKPDPASTVIR